MQKLYSQSKPSGMPDDISNFGSAFRSGAGGGADNDGSNPTVDDLD
jgi:hypothetical protein